MESTERAPDAAEYPSAIDVQCVCLRTVLYVNPLRIGQS